MRFVLFLRSIGQQAHIIVHVEIEERPRLAAGFVDNEVVECIVLEAELVRMGNISLQYTCVWYNQVLLKPWALAGSRMNDKDRTHFNIHQVVCTDPSKLW
jgi:hypothetical protein